LVLVARGELAQVELVEHLHLVLFVLLLAGQVAQLVATILGLRQQLAVLEGLILEPLLVPMGQ
jgi:hypothetical protein